MRARSNTAISEFYLIIIPCILLQYIHQQKICLIQYNSREKLNSYVSALGCHLQGVLLQRNTTPPGATPFTLLMCISLLITKTKAHVYTHTRNSLSHTFNTSTLQFNDHQFYIFWDFNILITPTRAMHGLQALPEDRPGKRRNAVEYQSNSVTWWMADGAFTFYSLPATLRTTRFNIKTLYRVITLSFNVLSEQTATFALYYINSLVFITEAERVYCAVRTEALYNTYVSSLKG